MNEYKITLNETQLLVLEMASELILRLGLTQYKHIFDTISMLEKSFKFDHDVNDEILYLLRNQLDGDENKSFISSMNTSRGIGSKTTPETSKVACDLYQSLRYARSWANAEHKPEERNEHFIKYMTVNFDYPMKYSKEKLPKVELINK